MDKRRPQEDSKDLELLTYDEERALLKEAQLGNSEARNKLIEKNMNFIRKKVKRYCYAKIEFEDLLHEGVIGMIRAIEKFDLSRKTRLSTYAESQIQKEICTLIEHQALFVRQPRNVYILLSKLSKVQEQLVGKLNREPSTTELAIELGVTEERMRQLLDIKKEAIDYDLLVQKSTQEVGMAASYQFGGDPEQVYEKTDMQQQVWQLLDEADLNEKQRLTIMLRYMSDKKYTQKEIGEIFFNGAKRQVVNQYEL